MATAPLTTAAPATAATARLAAVPGQPALVPALAEARTQPGEGVDPRPREKPGSPQPARPGVRGSSRHVGPPLLRAQLGGSSHPGVGPKGSPLRGPGILRAGNLPALCKETEAREVTRSQYLRGAELEASRRWRSRHLCEQSLKGQVGGREGHDHKGATSFGFGVSQGITKQKAHG